MKRRFVSILCAATMVASLMTGATVVSAADKDVKDISIGVIFWQRIALWKRRYHRLKILLLKEVMFFF